MKKLKNFAIYLKDSIIFLVKPKSWITSFKVFRDFFPTFQILIRDDIEINKIVGFVSKTRKEEKVYEIITIISLIIGAIALVPGQMGPYGVGMCRALEFYMAFEIAKTVGLKVEWKSFYKIIIATGIIVLSITWLMVSFIGFFASLVFFAPAVVLATNFLGIFFWLAFEELHKFKKNTKLSSWKALRIAGKAIKLSIGLGKAQIKVIGKFATKLKQTSKNIWYVINFKKNTEAIIKGDLFFAIAGARLLQSKTESFNGPFGQMWLDAWRKSYTQELGSESTFEEISKFAQSHSAEQMPALLKPVQGKFFEIIESQHENADGDTWVNELSDVPNEPIVDAKMINTETGRSYHIQYKYTENQSYIEGTLQQYPDVQIIVPKGVAEKIDHPMILDGNYDYDEVNQINNENFDNLLDHHYSEYLALGGVSAGLLALAANILPFIYARKKGSITKDQFQEALKKFVPNITATTIHRVTALSLIGPLYAFFLIAKFMGKIVLEGIDDEEESKEQEIKKENKTKQYSRREFFLFFKPEIT